MPTNESEISELVDTFYGKIRNDSLIGPIFNSVIEDWDIHLAKMKTFWSSVMLASHTYKGNPMIVHMNLQRLEREHFDRWLSLWRETNAEVCDEPAASMFVMKAEMIAERLLYGNNAYHDSVLASPDGEKTVQVG